MKSRNQKTRSDTHGFSGVVMGDSIALVVKAVFLNKYAYEIGCLFDKLLSFIGSQRLQSLLPFVGNPPRLKLILYSLRPLPYLPFNIIIRYENEGPRLHISTAGRRTRNGDTGLHDFTRDGARVERPDRPAGLHDRKQLARLSNQPLIRPCFFRLCHSGVYLSLCSDSIPGRSVSINLSSQSLVAHSLLPAIPLPRF